MTTLERADPPALTVPLDGVVWLDYAVNDHGGMLSRRVPRIVTYP